MTGHRGGSARFISADISESTLRFLRRAQYPLPCTQLIAAGEEEAGRGKKAAAEWEGSFSPVLPSSASPLPSSASPCPPLPPSALLCTFSGPFHPLCLCPVPFLLCSRKETNTKMRLPDKIQFGSQDTYRVCARYKA